MHPFQVAAGHLHARYPLHQAHRRASPLPVPGVAPNLFLCPSAVQVPTMLAAPFGSERITAAVANIIC